jgi:hypothetical protein
MSTTAIQSLVKASLEEYAETQTLNDIPSHDELDHIESELTEAHGAVAAHTTLAESEHSEDDIEAMKDFIKSTAIRISELAGDVSEAPTVVNASLEAAGEEHQKGMATRAIEALKRFFGNLIRHITAFLGMLFGGLGRLSKKIVALKQAAQAIGSDAKPKHDKIALNKAYLFGSSFSDMVDVLEKGPSAYRALAAETILNIGTLNNGGTYKRTTPKELNWPVGYSFVEGSHSTEVDKGTHTMRTSVVAWQYKRTSENMDAKSVEISIPSKAELIKACDEAVALLNDVEKFGKEARDAIDRGAEALYGKMNHNLNKLGVHRNLFIRTMMSSAMSNFSAMNRIGYVVLNAAAKTIHSGVATY